MFIENSKEWKFMLFRFLRVLCALCLLVAAFVVATPAYASSVYDDAYVSTGDLRVGQDHFYNSQTCTESEDLAYTWDEFILDPDLELVSGYDEDYEELRESFELAVSTGSYGVSQTYDTAPTSGQYMETILVFWTTDTDARLDWFSYGYPGYRFGVDYSSLGGEIHFAQIGNEIAVTGTGGCDIGWGYPDTTGYSSLSSLYNWVSNDSWASPPSGSYHANGNLFVHGADIYEPTGYEGEEVVTERPTPIPHYGTVDCAGVNPESMHFTQPGNDGYATLAYVSLGIASWTYSLIPNSQYSVTVDCDGTTGLSEESVLPSGQTDNWYCVPSGLLQPYICEPG